MAVCRNTHTHIYVGLRSLACDLGFRGLGVKGLGFRAWGLGLRVSGLRVKGSKLWV